MTSQHRLYGAEVSYFTGKVRAYLRWKGLPYTEVPATAEVYKSVIVARVGFPVIPVLETADGRTLQDSSDIIDTLERESGEPSITPAGGVQRLVSQLFELYGDEWLVIPAMHYRWHHNREWALQQFGALNLPDATPEDQIAAGAKRAGPFAQAAVLLGAEPHMHAAVERSYEALLGELDAHFAQHDYVLGSRPCLGDFGLYGPLYAHQFRDPASGALMRHLAPNLVRWIERMKEPPAPRTGEFLPGDALPATLAPVLRRMMREQLPVLQDSLARLLAWLAEHPGERIPRVIGSHAFELEGERGTRIIRPYSLWMLQRVLQVLRGLSADDRRAAEAMLAGVGGEALLSGFDTLPPLRRDGMSIALA